MTTAVYTLDETATRDDLALWFAVQGFNTGAEIGVERGLYAEVLCKANPDLYLTCVDAWQAYRGYREHVSQDKLDGFYAETRDRLKHYCVNVLRMWSAEAAANVANESLDFCYLDSNHTFAYVVADLAAWVPKVRSGGIVAGHDYGRSSVGHVKEAVDAWVSAYKIEGLRILRGDKSPSWFWVQP